ncbi:hypothetical protein TCAL_16975 [Tigriopus californicus]|uniref:Uncharacterized protein n=1 Tax=Tigriopus californicus TaxID=6832 RepID=A0A553PG72_TIGCA|nr:hypothetical protein TCAL_16975 [Tigriopus californicus]
MWIKVISVACIGYHENFTERFWDRVPSTSETSFESISNAFFSALYALNGWQIAGDLAEEIRKPKSAFSSASSWSISVIRFLSSLPKSPGMEKVRQDD